MSASDLILISVFFGVFQRRLQDFGDEFTALFRRGQRICQAVATGLGRAGKRDMSAVKQAVGTFLPSYKDDR